MHHDIFISYSKKDRDFAEALVQDLRNAGLKVWWDDYIPTGAQWQPEIEKALVSAKCVIVLWSRYSVQSTFVKDEANDAFSRNVMVPVIIDGSIPPLGFRQVQYIDLSNWNHRADDSRFRRLLHDVRKMIDEEYNAPPPIITVDPPPKKKMIFPILPILIGVGVMLMGAIGVIVWPDPEPKPLPSSTQFHSLRGYLKDSNDRPLADLAVKLTFHEKKKYYVTQEDGSFKFEQLAADIPYIVWHDKYSLEIDDLETTHILMIPECEHSQEETETIAGSLVDVLSLPLSNQQFKIRTGENVETVTTNQDGQFEFSAFNNNRSYTFLLNEEKVLSEIGPPLPARIENMTLVHNPIQRMEIELCSSMLNSKEPNPAKIFEKDEDGDIMVKWEDLLPAEVPEDPHMEYRWLYVWYKLYADDVQRGKLNISIDSDDKMLGENAWFKNPVHAGYSPSGYRSSAKKKIWKTDGPFEIILAGPNKEPIETLFFYLVDN